MKFVMDYGEKQNLLAEYRVKKALQVLKKDIKSIPTVKAWADEACVSREWLYKSMKDVYTKSPKRILREIRYEKVVQSIQNLGLESSSYSVAVDAGFRDEKALSKFLSSFYRTNFTLLKTDILKGKVRVDFIWLSGIHK